MHRRLIIGCLFFITFGSNSQAQDVRTTRPNAAPIGYDVRGARPNQTPYAPANAYVPAGATGVNTQSPVTPARYAKADVTPAPQPAPPLVMPAPSGYAPTANAGNCGTCDAINRLCCEPCGPAENGWVRADYLLWAVQSGSIPALAVRDVPGTARQAVGLPNTAGRQVLLGNDRLGGDLRSGFRISGGIWLDDCRQWGLSGDFFFLSTGTDGGRFTSAGDPPLSRPFFNVATGLPDAQLVSFPGVLAGSVNVNHRNTFSGAGAFLSHNLCCDFCGDSPCDLHGYRVDLLMGYRHYYLGDDLRIREDLLGTGQGRVPPGTRVIVQDRFRTENTFHGGLIGLNAETRWGTWSADFRVAAAIGNMHRDLRIDGSTTVLAQGVPPSVRTGGLLAQPTNIGRYSSDEFTVIPEAGLNLGCQITQGVRLHVGYTFLYLPNTWRAGDMIDRGVDPVQLQGVRSTLGRPAPILASTGTWVQGMNLGVRFSY